MTSMTRDLVRVVGGIDTHKDLHTPHLAPAT